MRGSVTRISRDGAGSILAEDGKEVHFERSRSSRNGVDDLRVGHWVEFELQYGFERPSAVNIKRLHGDVGQRPGAPNHS
jgi:cold shock CspA family protein